MPSNISPTRAQAIVIYELLLFSKLGIITALLVEQVATTGNNPKGRQRTKGGLHVKVPSDSPHTRAGTSIVWATGQAIGAWLGQPPTH